MGVSVPYLHRKSTDSLIVKLDATEGRRQPTLVGGARQDNVFARNLRAMACTYAHLRICVMYMKNHVHSAPQ